MSTPTQTAPSNLEQQILAFLRNNGRKSYRPKEIAKRLDIRGHQNYKDFRALLESLKQTGQVNTRKGGRIQFKPASSRMEGTLRVNPRGFGFVEVEDRADDIYVRASNMNTALDGDYVRVSLIARHRRDDRQEGEVTEVVRRQRTRAVGTLLWMDHIPYVEPDDPALTHDIYVPSEEVAQLAKGTKVVVSIERFDHPRAAPQGRLLEVLGDSQDPEVRTRALIYALNLDETFPKEVVQEAQQIPTTIPASEIKRRLDLRAEAIFTIDPVDAKDFDDAIHVKQHDDGSYEVGVHIADVSHYVRPDTKLDEEAFGRGTSVYLVDRVLPMLPEALSNGVCSLRPREDKLALSCLMQVSPEGDVTGYEIRETVICSHHRLTYEQAQAIIVGDLNHPYSAEVQRAQGLARTLTSRRMREGSVDFDLPEIRIQVDEAGHPTGIIRKERLYAHRLVEEFMLLANRTVARHMSTGEAPPSFVYRTHAPPDTERMTNLAKYVRTFNQTLPHADGLVSSTDLNALLNAVQGRPEAFVIQTAALRAMSKAVYSPEQQPHYGLGFEHYTHFTSPIRRYPDLVVHRLLKARAGGPAYHAATHLKSICKHCSEQEQEATTAERESVKLKQVEYIQEHLGESFDGVITGVTNFGLFVQLSDILVEGLVHVRDLNDDYYEYDERTYSLVGTYTGTRYRPGDPLRVQVVRANLDTREVDLLLAD
ncbi:MAG: ribonuclease R [Bacteroidota bacterium]